MPQRKNLKLGFLGEKIAADFLVSQGYQILERNFKNRYSEIDLVCLENKTLVFVEVKTRMSDEFGSPKEAVGRRKIQSLVKSAQFYKHLHPELPDSLRIDVVSLKLTGEMKKEEIELIRNITL